MDEPVLNGDSRVQAGREHLGSQLGEAEAAVMSLKSGSQYHLDTVGGRVWELLQEPRNVSEIRDLLLEEFEVDSAQCERDLLDLLVELQREGLIEVIE